MPAPAGGGGCLFNFPGPRPPSLETFLLMFPPPLAAMTEVFWWQDPPIRVGRPSRDVSSRRFCALHLFTCYPSVFNWPCRRDQRAVTVPKHATGFKRNERPRQQICSAYLISSSPPRTRCRYYQETGWLEQWSQCYMSLQFVFGP